MVCHSSEPCCASRVLSARPPHGQWCVWLSLLASLAGVGEAHATSYLIPLEKKVFLSTLILRVSITETSPPETSRYIMHAVCKAKVLDVLKGPADLKEVEFRGTTYGSFAPEKLPQLVGKDCIVFLHEPRNHNGQHWLFEGPRGIRPMADEFTEHRVKDGRAVMDKYSRSNYVAKIRELVNAKNGDLSSKYALLRSWTEQRTGPTDIPAEERIFVMSFARTNYAAIVRHRPGIPAREVVKQTGFASDAKAATIYRARNILDGRGPALGFSVNLRSTEDDHYEIQPMDVLEVHTTLPIITR